MRAGGREIQHHEIWPHLRQQCTPGPECFKRAGQMAFTQALHGFDTPPMILMGHDPAYAGKRVEEQGYLKAKDVFAYRADETGDIPEVAQKRVKRGLPAGVVLRQRLTGVVEAAQVGQRHCSVLPLGFAGQARSQARVQAVQPLDPGLAGIQGQASPQPIVTTASNGAYFSTSCNDFESCVLRS